MNWLLKGLIDHIIEVHADTFKVIGRLKAVSDPQRYPAHEPGVLVLETAAGPCIIREWSIIVFGGRP